MTETEMDKILLALEKEDKDRQEAMQAYREVSVKLGLREGKPFMKWLVRTAAILSIPLAAGLAYSLAVPDRLQTAQWTELSIPAGETRDIVLADGSCLTLNSGSRITYPDRFEGTSREIFLDGEVAAEIAKDKDKPFLIHSGDMTLQVFGTKFDFKTYSNSDFVELLLIEGSVRLDIDFNGQKQMVTMSPGEFVQCSKSSRIIEKKQYLMDGEDAFTSCRLSFRNIPVKDIALDLQRRFAVPVIVLDEEIAERKAFAIFSNGEDLHTVLGSLCDSQEDMKYWERGGVCYIDRK